MKKAAVVLGTLAFLMLAAPAAFASHGGPHCAKSQGQGTQGGQVAGNSLQECYPPPGQAAQAQQAGKKASFQFERDGGITVGVLVIAGLGAVTLFLATSAVLRRRLIS